MIKKEKKRELNKRTLKFFKDVIDDYYKKNK